MNLFHSVTECASSKHKISIAVLSPFPAQVQCLQQKVEMHYENNNLLNVKVGFFQDYEGAEDDVTIISTVGTDGDEFNELKRSRQLNTNDYFKSKRCGIYERIFKYFSSFSDNCCWSIYTDCMTLTF